MWPIQADPVQPAAAIAWFRARVTLTPEAYRDLEDRARRKAFTVAGVADLGLLNEAFGAIDKAISDGTTFEDFQREIGGKLEAKWGKPNGGRLSTIFQTNVQSAYSAGRWRQLTDPNVLRERPMWMYDAVLDGRVSDLCKGLDGTIRPADDPWWETHTPPLHFNCRSGIISLTEDEAGARGITATPPKVPAASGFGLAPDKGEWSPRLDKYPQELQQAYAAAGGGSGGGGGRKPMVSEHPTDKLILELVQRGREPSEGEVSLILERMQAAPFNPQVVKVPRDLRGEVYKGQTLESRADSSLVHLVRRVKELQWREGTTAEEYLADLQRAVRHPEAELVLYDLGRGPVAATLSPTSGLEERRGENAEAFTYVIFGTDRASIITGYMTSGKPALTLPEGVTWYRSVKR